MFQCPLAPHSGPLLHSGSEKIKEMLCHKMLSQMSFSYQGCQLSAPQQMHNSDTKPAGFGEDGGVAVRGVWKDSTGEETCLPGMESLSALSRCDFSGMRKISINADKV